jgi:archaellum component FlaC
MLAAITMFIVAVSSAIASYFIQKRIDKIQERINDLENQINTIKFDLEKSDDSQRAINDNLDKQIKSQYSHFTSRMDKLKNDVLQNTRQY